MTLTHLFSQLRCSQLLHTLLMLTSYTYCSSLPRRLITMSIHPYLADASVGV